MRRLIVCLLLAGCPSSQVGGAGAGSATVKTGPDFHKGAADDEAIILGTTSDGGSTKLALAKGDSSVNVDAMWVKMGPPVSGGSTPVKLTAGPNADHKVKVGFYEEFNGGMGPQWRAGVWLAAFVSSTTLNKDLTDFTFTADAGGMIDGASASGLMTAGYLASILGQKIDPTATMTGIINPDGTIGPVGGIPHKFAGSIAKGKKRLGYPIGMRFSEDMNTGENVDLEKIAKDGGATAVEISDVYGAYALMTGQKLPQPLPVDESDMALESEVNDAFEQKYGEWQSEVNTEWDTILQMNDSGQLPDTLVSIANAAQNEVTTAENLRKQGLPSAAYDHIVNALVYAASATYTGQMLTQIQKGDVLGAKASLHEIEGLAGDTEAVLRNIGTMKPNTMGGHLQMLSAYDKGIAALAAYMHAGDAAALAEQYLDGLSGYGKDELSSPEMADDFVNNISPTVLAIARAKAYTMEATDAIDIEGVKSLDYMCSLPNVKKLATSFQSAASANVTYFETLVGITDETSRNYGFSREPDYLTAYISANLENVTGAPDTLKQEWGEDSLSWRLMSLSAAELAYFKASTLISKWYSLGVQNDPYTGWPTSVQYEKAFINMLGTAQKKALENARAAKVATGAIPVQARISYQNALVLREGDVGDKLAALEGFWQSSAYSQTAVMLARN